MLPKNIPNTQLRTNVFPRMLADQVSLKAKKDALICAYGSRYINTHREQHHINICSRKMRELAKLLIQCQKLEPTIKNLFDLLQPQFFDMVVESVKVIARYNPETDVYRSPTFAMNISRSLKDCCDIAILHIIKRKSPEAEANIGKFRQLLENMWKHEISSHAGRDLNTKTWNKVTLVPLATDLKMFRSYLVEKGNTAAQLLQQDKKKYAAFILLTETVFCRLLLLNRKRVGELQRIELSTYMACQETSSTNYEEFSDAITPAEKLLLKNFKRVVTRGKRGRGVPVLISRDVQDHIKILLQARPEFINKKNLFLFANPNSESQPIVGYKVVQKHARMCGAKNPHALTSTRLRKHLATLTQLFSMTESDIEQLATFMGHTVDIHKHVYRLPDDVYQTAKIAKLLMLMEKGDAAKYKGKALNDIDLDMEELVNDNYEETTPRTSSKEDEQSEISAIDDDIAEAADNSRNNLVQNHTNNKYVKKRVLVKWTSEQKQVVTRYFKQHVKEKRPPKRAECEALIEQHPELLENKSWTKIKVFIQNLYTKNKD
nr:unnamed protein product [Callosobruchus analis]